MKRAVDSGNALTPGTALMAGQIVAYLLTIACLNTLIGHGAASNLLKSSSLLVAAIFAVISGIVFEMHVYKRFISDSAPDDMEADLVEHAREQLRLAASPWWHFVIAALIGVSLGVAMAGALNWWHGQS
jgi:hypothetical protein